MRAWGTCPEAGGGSLLAGEVSSGPALRGPAPKLLGSWWSELRPRGALFTPVHLPEEGLSFSVGRLPLLLWSGRQLGLACCIPRSGGLNYNSSTCCGLSLKSGLSRELAC